MGRHRGPVLVDTNVILECWRVDAWRALAGGYAVETVEDCVTETQTGFQRRHREPRSSPRWPRCTWSATLNWLRRPFAIPHMPSSMSGSVHCGRMHLPERMRGAVRARYGKPALWCSA